MIPRRIALACALLFAGAMAIAHAMPGSEMNNLDAPDVLRNAASSAYAAGDLATARASFERCVRVSREQGDRSNQVACSAFLARTLLRLNDDADALESAQRSITDIAGASDSVAYQAFLVYGDVLRKRGDAKGAVEAYKRALGYVSGNAHETDYSAQGVALDHIARVYLDLRRYGDAGAFETRAADFVLREPQSRDIRELSVLEDSGEVAWGLHRFSAALTRFAQVMNVAPGAHVDPVDMNLLHEIEMRADYGTGDAKLQQGMTRDATAPLQQCEPGAPGSGIGMLCAIDLAEADVDANDDNDALAALVAAKPQMGAAAPDDRVSFLVLSAAVALERGEFESARSNALAAIAADGHASSFAVGRADYTMFVVASTLGSSVCGSAPCAKLWRDRALHAWRGLSPESVGRFAFLGAGGDAFALESAALQTEANPHLAAVLAREADVRASKARARGTSRYAMQELTTAARLWLRAGDARRAESDANQAYRGVGTSDWKQVWLAGTAFSAALSALHRVSEAAVVCRSTIEAFEDERSRVELLAMQDPGIGMEQTDLGAGDILPEYERCIGLQMSSGNAAGGLRIFDLEQGRIVMRYFVAGGGARLAGVPQEKLDRLRLLERAYARARTEAQDDPTADQGLALTSAERDVNADLAALDASYPSFAYLYHASSPQEDWRNKLRPDEAMLVLDVQLGSVYRWVVSGRELNGAVFPATRLARAIDTYVDAVGHIEGRADFVHALEESSGALDADGAALWRDFVDARTENELAGYTKIFFVPTGAMYRVPIGALKTMHGYAGERWGFSVLSSPSLLSLLRADSPLPHSRSLLAFADPQFGPGTPTGGTISASAIAMRGGTDLAALPALPGTGLEAAAAATALGSRYGLATIVSGSDATKTRLEQISESGDAARYRYVLFATHAIVPADLREPLLVLSQPDATTGGGVLTPREITKLRLSADLVVLSACETGYTKLREAEGESEFGRSFLAAGARAVALTLWELNDTAAQGFTSGMFGQLAQGAAPSEALRAEQEAFLRHGPADLAAISASPYLWGSYVIFGDGFTPSVP